jgi:hypothetical protein
VRFSPDPLQRGLSLYLGTISPQLCPSASLRGSGPTVPSIAPSVLGYIEISISLRRTGLSS